MLTNKAGRPTNRPGRRSYTASWSRHCNGDGPADFFARGMSRLRCPARCTSKSVIRHSDSANSGSPSSATWRVHAGMVHQGRRVVSECSLFVRRAIASWRNSCRNCRRSATSKPMSWSCNEWSPRSTTFHTASGNAMNRFVQGLL